MTPAFIQLKSSTNWAPSGTSRSLNLPRDVNRLDSVKYNLSEQRSRDRQALRSLKNKMRGA
jgi:hypothetical protein